MSKETGGPAFPNPMKITCPECKVQMAYAEDCEGMTLRDYFAAKVMQSLLVVYGKEIAENSHASTSSNEKSIAEVSYKIAEAMLSERDK